LDKTKKPPPPPAAAPAPSPAPATAPAPASTNAAPAPAAKPPGTASDGTFHDRFAYELSLKSIDDSGRWSVGPTYFQNFAPKVPQKIHRLQPIRFLNQQTMKGWMDSNYPYPLAP
jgi:hypothetical protein